MSKENNLKDFLIDLADAIREKKNIIGNINPQNFSNEIKSISGGFNVDTKLIDDTYYGANNLREITFNDPISIIGAEALKDHTFLKKVTMFDPIESIESEAFKGCSDLETVICYAYNPPTLGESVFDNINPNAQFLVPEYRMNEYINSNWGVTGRIEPIDENEFVDYVSATGNVDALVPEICGNTGTVYVKWQLLDNGDLYYINSGDVKYIKCTSSYDWRSSAYINSVKRLFIAPDTIYIGVNTFAFLTHMKEINIPESVKKVSTTAFGGLYPGNIIIKCTPLSYDKRDYGLFSNNIHIQNVEFDNNIVDSGDYTFYGCSNLLKVKLPQGLTRIGNCTFENCTSLKTINLPDTVTNIGGYTFTGSGLQSINIPSSVRELGWGCFRSCPELKNVTFLGVPNGSWNINPYAFLDSRSIEYIDFSRCNKKPGLINPTQTFYSTTKIVVADDMYDYWIEQDASGWYQIASKVVKHVDYFGVSSTIGPLEPESTGTPSPPSTNTP